MSKVKILVRDNGSLFVTGDVELVDAEGKAFPAKEKMSLCRCGLSNNKPYCDGAHKGVFESQVRAPEPAEE